MALLGISTGTTPNDGTGDSLIVGADKVNKNFQEIYNAVSYTHLTLPTKA